MIKYNGEPDGRIISGLRATCKKDLPLCALVVVGLEIEDNTNRLQSEVFASTGIGKHLFHLLLREAMMSDGVRGFVVGLQDGHVSFVQVRSSMQEVAN